MKVVLISGGSGLIGKTITDILLKQNVEVRWLSTRTTTQHPNVKVYLWSPKAMEIDAEALNGVDTVINLAGEAVAQRWTRQAKSAIFNSRVQSVRTLAKAIEAREDRPSSFINASAVGYYPDNNGRAYLETDEPGNDFLAKVVTHWEKEVGKVSDLGVQTAMLRIGIVLDKSGGALGQMLPFFKIGLGSPLGSGKQWMPWIHVEDLARMFIHLARNEEAQGVYNAAGPNQVRNAEFSKTLAQAMNKPFFAPAVPSFMLKLVLGKMATIALASTKVSVEKIQNTGFEWKHPELLPALQDVLK